MTNSYHSQHEDATIEAAARLASTLEGDEIIFLVGELGAGKTIFAKGMARALGIEDTITSPTYTYFNSYYSGRYPMHHFDLYRVNEAEDMLELGIHSQVCQKGIKLVEWPDILDIQPNIIVTIDKISDDERGITIEKIS